MVELEIVDSISYETVRRTLKKGGVKPWLKQQWAIPTVSPEFVWRMEDRLDLYAEPVDDRRPIVCLDECPVQLEEVRAPLSAQPGQPEPVDYQYKRNGTGNVLIAVEPQLGTRHIEVTARRTKRDFAQPLKALVDERHPDAEVIRLVVDNLNPHTPAALYQCFSPEEARRITGKLEFHYTPKHGTWLNMAEIELSVFARQCLNRRMSDPEYLSREAAAWKLPRNGQRAPIQWRFTSADARIHLNRLYPAHPL